MPPRQTKTLANASLLTALEFVEPVMETNGNASQTHVILHQGWCSAFDGVLAMAHPIEEDISSCPHFVSLKAALKRSAAACSIIVNDNGSLNIRSGPFKAIIKSAEIHQIMTTQPDIASVGIDDRIKTGFSALVSILKDEDPSIVKCALLLNEQTMIGTDAVMFLEFWHGLSLPKIMIPKATIGVVSKIKRPLAAMGVSERSVTFYFDNGAWVRSQLMTGTTPNLSRITDLVLTCPRVPLAGLVEGVEAVMPHGSDEAPVVHFGDGVVRSHREPGVGAEFDVPGLAAGPIYNAKYLLQALKLAQSVQFDVVLGETKIMGFHGENCRGFLMPRID